MLSNLEGQPASFSCHRSCLGPFFILKLPFIYLGVALEGCCRELPKVSSLVTEPPSYLGNISAGSNGGLELLHIPIDK